MNDYLRNAFKTQYRDIPKGGQCFECGLWFTTGKGYACCKEHKHKSKIGYSNHSTSPTPQFRSI